MTIITEKRTVNLRLTYWDGEAWSSDQIDEYADWRIEYPQYGDAYLMSDAVLADTIRRLEDECRLSCTDPDFSGETLTGLAQDAIDAGCRWKLDVETLHDGMEAVYTVVAECHGDIWETFCSGPAEAAEAAQRDWSRLSAYDRKHQHIYSCKVLLSDISDEGYYGCQSYTGDFDSAREAQ